VCALPSGRPASPLLTDWPDCAWEDPWCDSADPRSQHLDPIADHEAPRRDFAIFGDGIVLFLLGLLVFVRKRAGLVLRPVIGTVTPTSRPGLLLACRNSLAPGRRLCMWPSWFHCWSVFAGAVLTRGTY
jgi:hypothetical protein